MTGRAASPNKVVCIFRALEDGKLLTAVDRGTWAERKATSYRPNVTIDVERQSVTWSRHAAAGRGEPTKAAEERNAENLVDHHTSSVG